MLCALTVRLRHLPALSGNFVHLLNCATLSLTQRCTLFSLSLKGSSFPSPQKVSLPYLYHLRVPPSAPSSSLTYPSLLQPSQCPQADLSRGLTLSLHFLPWLPRSEAPPPGHLTAPDAPPTEPPARAGGDWRTQAAVAATATATATLPGLRSPGEQLRSPALPRRLDGAVAAPVCLTSQGPVTSPSRGCAAWTNWWDSFPRFLSCTQGLDFSLHPTRSQLFWQLYSFVGVLSHPI